MVRIKSKKSYQTSVVTYIKCYFPSCVFMLSPLLQVFSLQWHELLNVECQQMKICIQIAKNCTDPDPSKRPTISEIKYQLKEAKPKIQKKPCIFTSEMRRYLRATLDLSEVWSSNTKKSSIIFVMLYCIFEVTHDTYIQHLYSMFGTPMFPNLV